MTNREKYLNDILSKMMWAVVDGKIAYCSNKICDKCLFAREICEEGRLQWLNEEYKEYTEPEVDWSKVAVDTPILVRDRDGDAWRPRYFAKYENDQICTWGNGATSWSGDGSMSCWNEAKLAEDDNGK